MNKENKLIKSAPEFDVHWVTEHKEVNEICDVLFKEIESKKKACKGRIKNKKDYWEHIRKIILDLLVAYKLQQNPYRSISKNKTEYQAKSASRYNKLFLKYDPFVGCLNELIELGYIEQHKGFHFVNNARRTRIKASNKLIAIFKSSQYGLETLIKNNGILKVISHDTLINLEETIILKNDLKEEIDYEDAEETKSMRGNLQIINNALEKSHITLEITDEQYRELAILLNERWKEDNSKVVNFSNKRLHRVFNNSTFNNGGRFYGAWWINLPKDYRKYIRIDYKDTIEVDFSGHHIRMLYAEKGIELSVDKDPYEINGLHRDIAKQAMLLILNNLDKEKAINTMRSEGIKKAKLVCEMLEEKYHHIKDKFYKIEANNLMKKDSEIAERIMLRMLEIGLVILPIHDSFIVSRKYEEVLINVMEEEFGKEFKIKTKTKSKDIFKNKATIHNEDSTVNITETMDFIMKDESNKSIVRGIWGAT